MVPERVRESRKMKRNRTLVFPGRSLLLWAVLSWQKGSCSPIIVEKSILMRPCQLVP